MKKKIYIFAFAFVVGLGGYNLYSAQQVDQYSDMFLTEVEAIANDTENGRVCKYKLYDCPGWGTGSDEACLENGDGHECTCGTVSRDCPR